MWALGGDKHKPSTPQNTNSEQEPYIKIELNNGIVVERKGANSDLKVTDERGMYAGQKLLNEIIGQMALDLPKFNDADSKGKAKILMGVLGIEDKLDVLETKEKSFVSDRHDIGVQRKQKEGAFEACYFCCHWFSPIKLKKLIKHI